MQRNCFRGEGQYRGLIQIQSNALAALEAIDMDVAEEVMRDGCITGDRINGLVDGISGSCRHDRGAEDRPRLTSFEENMLSKHQYFATSSIEGSTHPDNMLNSHASSWLVHQKKESGGKGRDNELHRLLFTRNGLPDGAELAYYFKGQKLLQGYKRDRGIVCGHCDRE
ncbi:hypothetical protein Droror1_Dr00017739 [Drosera rotundifolia]